MVLPALVVDMVGTTTTKRRSIAQKFLAANAGEVYHSGRLATVSTENGIALVAYGNEILAEISEDGENVTLYIGHHSEVSQTVTGYIKVLGSVLSNTEGKNVTVLRDAAPTMGIGARASHSAQYISNYVGAFAEKRSAVEKDAMKNVERALSERMAEIFGE